MKIQKIFEAFENHNLTTDKPGKLFVQLKAGLAQVSNFCYSKFVIVYGKTNRLLVDFFFWGGYYDLGNLSEPSKFVPSIRFQKNWQCTIIIILNHRSRTSKESV